MSDSSRSSSPSAPPDTALNTGDTASPDPESSDPEFPDAASSDAASSDAASSDAASSDASVSGSESSRAESSSSDASGPELSNPDVSGCELQGSDTPVGVVTRSTGSWYDVQVGDRTIKSRVRGKFRLAQEEADQTNPVAVGDRVTLRLNEDDDTGFITEIHDRETKLSRRAAGRRAGQEHVIVANVDFAWAVQAVQMPRLNPGFIDRFLISADMFDVPAGIILNKIDLLATEDADDVAEIAAMYEDLGYPVLRTSATEGTGIDELHEALTDRISVVAGPSGAGKSSLLNAIEPGLDVETGEVSQKTEKGKHTTTFAELHPISGGGYIVDTPGIREFGLLELHPADLAHFFVEFVPYLDDCKFQDCTHDHEPGCAVKDAVDHGDIHPARYESYLNILYSLQEGEEGVGR